MCAFIPPRFHHWTLECPGVLLPLVLTVVLWFPSWQSTSLRLCLSSRTRSSPWKGCPLVLSLVCRHPRLYALHPLHHMYLKIGHHEIQGPHILYIHACVSPFNHINCQKISRLPLNYLHSNWSLYTFDVFSEWRVCCTNNPLKINYS